MRIWNEEITKVGLEPKEVPNFELICYQPFHIRPIPDLEEKGLTNIEDLKEIIKREIKKLKPPINSTIRLFYGCGGVEIHMSEKARKKSIQQYFLEFKKFEKECVELLNKFIDKAEIVSTTSFRRMVAIVPFSDEKSLAEFINFLEKEKVTKIWHKKFNDKSCCIEASKGWSWQQVRTRGGQIISKTRPGPIVYEVLMVGNQKNLFQTNTAASLSLTIEDCFKLIFKLRELFERFICIFWEMDQLETKLSKTVLSLKGVKGRFKALSIRGKLPTLSLKLCRIKREWLLLRSETRDALKIIEQWTKFRQKEIKNARFLRELLKWEMYLKQHVKDQLSGEWYRGDEWIVPKTPHMVMADLEELYERTKESVDTTFWNLVAALTGVGIIVSITSVLGIALIPQILIIIIFSLFWFYSMGFFKHG